MKKGRIHADCRQTHQEEINGFSYQSFKNIYPPPADEQKERIIGRRRKGDRENQSEERQGDNERIRG